MADPFSPQYGNIRLHRCIMFIWNQDEEDDDDDEMAAVHILYYNCYVHTESCTDYSLVQFHFPISL